MNEESILNVECSMVKNCQTPLISTVNLLKWLTQPNLSYSAQQAQVASELNLKKRKFLKQQMPAIMPSGLFSKRSANSLVRHTGFIAIDIDFNDNIHLKNFNQLGDELCKLSNVAYCSRSVSGNGYWLLIAIAYPEKHKEYFLYLKNFFESKGVNIDNTCGDITRLRFYSYYQNAFFNHKAKPLQNFVIANIINSPNQVILEKPVGDIEFVKTKILIKQISRRELDLTTPYKTWVNIAAALSNEFGENGRGYFHEMSKFHQDYDEDESNKLYSNCLAKKYKVGIGTLYRICKDAGLMFNASLAFESIIFPLDEGIK